MLSSKTKAGVAIALAGAGAMGFGSALNDLAKADELEKELNLIGSNISKEYELIMRKKSILSANKRRKVIRAFEARYK